MNIDPSLQRAVDCWIESKKHLNTVAREFRDNPQKARSLMEAQDLEQQARDAMALRLAKLSFTERAAILVRAYREVRRRITAADDRILI